MRTAFVTILPMFTAAIIVMMGGEFMSRRVTEERTSPDRERLLDFSEAFRMEMSRLDSLYLKHLSTVSSSAIQGEETLKKALDAQITGIDLVRVFPLRGRELSVSPSFKNRALPEVELENRKAPLNRETAIVLKAILLKEPMPSEGVWINTPGPDYRVHCQKPAPDRLVAILINNAVLSKRTTEHLTSWLELPLTPLKEAGERVQIAPWGGEPIVTIGSERHGPAASITSFRSISGNWQVSTWDGLNVTRHHDTITLIISSILALMFVISGILLYQQQRRALILATERVSFVNRVSHELGSPLTNLSLNLDLATEVLAGRPAEARRRLGIAAEEIERLSRLVANVLTFSSNEKKTLSLTPVRCVPEEVIMRTLDHFRPALKRLDIEVETDISANHTVTLDPDALSQTLGNLISNVEKYASSGGWMKIYARLEKESLILEVQDKGEGIPKAAQKRIFLPFERVSHKTNEGASGTGLGLAIGRDLAQHMGGTLELLASREGSLFRLTIPAPKTLKS